MKISKEQIDKIEEALLAAYRRPEEVRLPSDWRQQLMKDLRARTRPAPAPLVSRRILSWAAASLAIIAGILILANLGWNDPWIKIKSPITCVNCRTQVCLEAGCEDSGLKHLEVTVIQGGRKIPVLFHKIKQPKRFLGLFGAKIEKIEITVVLDAKALNLQQGPAKLVVAARDSSWRNNFQGRLATFEKDIDINLNPYN